jgi:5-methylcytosine-specific restriction endonuclease McrA
MNRTLVLDAAYQPVSIVNWQRALVLVFTKKAEIISESSTVIRSVSEAFALPSVVRLINYIKVYRRVRGIPCNRRNLLIRDNCTCQYCSKHLTREDATIDHVQPRSRGGDTSWENVVLACRKCNIRKASRTPQEAGMKLLRKPRRPTLMELVRDVRDYPPEDWKPFLEAG